MKKTLFLTLSFVAILGLVANNKCEAKKAVNDSHEMHEAAEHEAREVAQETRHKTACATSCKKVCCPQNSECNGWWNQITCWFSSFFKSEAPSKKSKKTKRAAATATAPATNSDCCAADPCCDAIE